MAGFPCLDGEPSFAAIPDSSRQVFLTFRFPNSPRVISRPSALAADRMNDFTAEFFDRVSCTTSRA
jgi:hypothetical protein